MYCILDLFSGAGGFSSGLVKNKNFEVKVATDINKDALVTYAHNHPQVKIIKGDITRNVIKEKIIKESKIYDVNMIIGGPPCQGFSLKGKKRGLEDSRNFLFLEFFELVKKIKPQIFIMENVAALINSSKGFFINEIIKLFSQIGYSINYDVLNASDFGVPQNRKRAFIIGSKEIKYDLPKGNLNKITVEDAISDLNFLKSGEIYSKQDYRLSPQSKYQKKMRKKSKSLFNHSATNHTLETLHKLNLIPEKGTKLDLPLSLRTNQKFATTWSRLRWNSLSPTIDTRFDTPSNGRNTHPILHRAITPREAARLQSFSDRYIFFGNKSQICKQIGNAVPPLLAKAIGDSIIKQDNIVFFEIQKNSKLIMYDSFKLYGHFENESFDAIITDPPYNISKENNFATMRQKRRGIDFGEWDKNFDLYSWIDYYYPKLKPGGSIIIFASYLYVSHISDRLIKLGAIVKDLLKWIKSNPMPRNIKRRYVSDTEFAIWAVKPGKKWTFNKKKETPYSRAEFRTSVVNGKERTKHPTQKSLKLMKTIISIHTNKSDKILDPFVGSGTTGIAAINLKREFVGIEKNKEYYEIAKTRFMENKI